VSDLKLLDEKIVVLWSGGLDSTCLIKIILNDHKGEVFPIFLKHGQRNVDSEFEAVEYYSSIFKKEYKDRFHTPFIATSDIPAKEFKEKNYDSRIYLRNSDMINNAIRFAAGNDINTIVLATFSYDMGDGKQEFFEIKEKETKIATDYRVRIFSPFFDNSFPCNTKTGLIDYSKKLGFDFSHTRSCYESSESPCEKCPACKNRNSALAESKFDF